MAALPPRALYYCVRASESFNRYCTTTVQMLLNKLYTAF